MALDLGSRFSTFCEIVDEVPEGEVVAFGVAFSEVLEEA